MPTQIDILTNYIMDKIPGEPSQSQGAGETAVRLLAQYREAFVSIMNELGVPGEGYPMNVANAYEIAQRTLEGRT